MDARYAPVGGHGVCRAPSATKFEVRRPSRSDDIAYLLCEHQSA